jgi:hypothetical protein
LVGAVSSIRAKISAELPPLATAASAGLGVEATIAVDVLAGVEEVADVEDVVGAAAGAAEVLAASSMMPFLLL